MSAELAGFRALPPYDNDSADRATTSYRRAQILCASVKVVGRDGALGARLKDIAKEAGVSLGLVQHYFGTRKELLEQTFQVMLNVSLSRIQQHTGADVDPLVTLIAMLRLHAYGSIDFQERWGFWIELWSSARRDPVLAEIAHDVYALWTEPFETAVTELSRQGRCRGDVLPLEASVHIMGLIDGLAVRALIDQRAINVEGLYRMLIDAATRQLGLDPLAVAQAVENLGTRPEELPTSSPLTPDVIHAVLRRLDS